MKKIKAVPLSFIYAGCFLGAGFISGQELWQFFGSFGLWGYLGFCVSATLFVVFGMIMLRLTQMTGCRELEKLLVPWDHLKWLQRAAGIVGWKGRRYRRGRRPRSARGGGRGGGPPGGHRRAHLSGSYGGDRLHAPGPGRGS